MTEHIGDLALTPVPGGWTATNRNTQLPGIYADQEAAIMASRLPVGLLADLTSPISVDDLEDADLGLAAEVEVDAETCTITQLERTQP